MSDGHVRAPALPSMSFSVPGGADPPGDHILANVHVGCWSFGLVGDQLRSALLEAAPAGRTDLLTALLRCAGRGESTPQVLAITRALSADVSHCHVDDALVDLDHVGHTSEAALAVGVVAGSGGRRGVRHS